MRFSFAFFGVNERNRDFATILLPRSCVDAVIVISTMTDRENAKHFQASHGIKNLVVATNLVVESLFPFLPAFRPSLLATNGTLASATVEAVNIMLLIGIIVHGMLAGRSRLSREILITGDFTF